MNIILGTSDASTIKHMITDTQRYMEERKAYLFAESRLMQYPEFLEHFSRQTKERCQSLAKEVRCSGYLDGLEHEILAATPATHTHYKLARAMSYARLCDHLLFKITGGKKGSYSSDFKESSRESFRLKVVHSHQYVEPSIGDRMVWLCTESGSFSMLDYLIVLSQNKHLGGARTNSADRDNFTSGDNLYKGHFGSIKLSIEEACSAIETSRILEKSGVSLADYVKDCFLQNNTGSVTEFAQKVLAAFAMINEQDFHYDESVQGVLAPKNAELNYRRINPLILELWGRGSEGSICDQEAWRIITGWRDRYLGKVNDQYIQKATENVEATERMHARKRRKNSEACPQ